VGRFSALRPRAESPRRPGKAGIPDAVAGGNVVAAWGARVDRAAVRDTQDVDIRPGSPPDNVGICRLPAWRLH